jgi:SAM-dependent methyltransferase
MSAFTKVLDAEPHTPVYMMHKYFARRPWNVFNELISHYSKPGDVVLDPFCGGGVTVVESLKLRRRAVGVDVNPIAAYITDMECRQADLQGAEQAFAEVSQRVEHQISGLYSTKCTDCRKSAIADWIEWDEAGNKIIRLKFDCPACGVSKQKRPTAHDRELARRIEKDFSATVRRRKLWYPRTRIPEGDKTNSLLNQKVHFFHELFTRRSLLALSMLLKEIEAVSDRDARDLLRFAFSGSLKWASRQSHLRGEIVEGWAMHAYWIYPKSLEINVWNSFSRRFHAVVRGKRYSNDQIGIFAKPARSFDDIANGDSSYLILNQSSAHLPLPDNSLDAVITDPPYGGNVNYGELSDFWFVWLSRGKTIEKKNEIIVNRTQSKTLSDYETLLSDVFSECHRVLRPGRCLVSTFNSRDMRVVAAFITAATRAGFKLHPEGFAYQKPIRSYTTTFHAMQIGAFVGDFIFTFIKEPRTQTEPAEAASDLGELKQSLIQLTSGTTKNEVIEPELREKAYGLLIPFLGANSDVEACKEAANFFEVKMRELEPHFKRLRQTITKERRREFRSRRTC